MDPERTSERIENDLLHLDQLSVSASCDQLDKPDDPNASDERPGCINSLVRRLRRLTSAETKASCDGAEDDEELDDVFEKEDVAKIAEKKIGSHFRSFLRNASLYSHKKVKYTTMALLGKPAFYLFLLLILAM